MSNLTRFKSATAVTLVTVLSAAMAGSALADTAWQQNHPRREQVNGRLAIQNARIHKEVSEGELTKGQAATLHKDDHQMRSEERDMASQNGSHITRQEQRTLNQQESRVSRQIGP